MFRGDRGEEMEFYRDRAGGCKKDVGSFSYNISVK
jgi:hypothetical protein